MSKIIVPSKPDWKIIIDIDTNGQTRIEIRDMLVGGAVSGVGARVMSQFKLCSILSQLITSTMISTEEMFKKARLDGKATQANDH